MDLKAKPEFNESESFLEDEPVVEIKNTNNDPEKIDFADRTAAGKENSFELTERIAATPLSAEDVIEICVWRDSKIRIIKPLIPLRMAMLLWFGGGRLLTYFFSAVLKQKGLNLVEYSSAFTVTFLGNFITAFVCGLVADKLGNAKPVLIFLISASLFIVISLLLGPNVRNQSCTKPEVTSSCSNISKSLENAACSNYVCLENSNGYVLLDESSRCVLTTWNRSDFFDNIESGDNETDKNLKFSGIVNFTTVLGNKNCSVSCLNSSLNKCNMRDKGLVAFYSIVIICFYSFWSTAYRFHDFVALSLAMKYGSNVGKERFVSAVGEFLVSIIGAFVLNVKTPSRTKIDYLSVYWCAAVILFLNIAAVYSIKAVMLPPGRKLMKKALGLCRNVEIMAFIAAVFIGGNAFCFCMNFNLLFLETLNASKTTIGLHLITSGFFGMAGYLSSNWWFKKFGTNNMIIVGLLAYVIKGLSYSFLQYPWMSLLIEFISIFSWNIFWIAVIVQGFELAPKGLAATLHAMSGTFHFGIGRSTAVFGGGILIHFVGYRMAYRILGALCFGTAVIYSLFSACRMKSSDKKSSSDRLSTRRCGKPVQ